MSMNAGGSPADCEFLLGGGDMGARMRAFDWTSTPLGAPVGWPAPLRHAIALCLASPMPTVIWWGRDMRLQFCNDACIALLGAVTHPPLLGHPGQDCWNDVWTAAGPLVDAVFTTGVPALLEDHLVVVDRELPQEEAYVTFSCVPIRGDENRVAGVFCSCVETTARVIAARRLDTLRRLDAQMTDAATVAEACAKAEAVLAENRHGVPFAAIYRPDASGRFSGTIVAAEALASVVQTRRPMLVNGLQLPGGAWPEPATQALLLPLSRLSHEAAFGVLALGVSPRRPLDAEYRTYFDLIAAHVSMAIVEARAREDERRHRDLFDSMIEAYCVIELIFDEDGRPVDFRYLETNPAFIRHAGQPMLGRRIKEIVPDFEQFWLDYYGRVAVTGEPAELEHRVAGLGDQWFHTSAFRIGGSESRRIGVVFENITERKRSEQALRESEATLRAIIEEAPLAIALTGRSGEIVLRNPRFDQLWGRPAHVTTASTYSEVYEGYHLDGRRIASEEWPGARAVLKGETVENEVYELVQADGRRIACWFGAIPLRSTGGEIVGAVVMFRDVTDERRTGVALRQANAALAEADRRKDQFIAVLSHELRNPLAPIRYALPLLGEEALGERGTRAIAVIERQVAHVVRLVDDLLDVSRIATGKIELRRDFVTLGSIVSTAVEAASPAIAAARHSLDIALPDQPTWLYVDPARIAQAMTNLLNNSAKYTPPGGRIRLEASVSGSSVIVRFIDNGIGLDREALGTVFELFRQADGRNGGQGGLGIGLTLARQLVELHGGSIEAHSAGEGRGAEFTIRLPLAVNTGPTQESAPTPAGSGQQAAIKVLVVDDNADLVEMLALVVEEAGHHVRKAFDGPSGISAALEYQPDLVLLDIGMPAMNGTEVVRELRRHRAVARARIVALTGWGQAEDRQRITEAGFDDHLVKPADPEQIKCILDEVAARKHSARGTQEGTGG